MSRLRNLTRSRWAMLLALLLVFFLGYALRGGGDGGVPSEQAGHGDNEAPTIWTCSMHPQIQQPEFGACPLCGMDLIPVSADAGAESPRELTLSPRAEKLAELRTAPVERRFVETEIRLVGRVDYDETRVKRIAARVPGRLDRLFVDYTGIRVAEGDHLVELYSPELISAQEELIQAVKGAEVLGETAVEVVRDKLLLLGLNERQIREIEARGAASDRVTLYAPIGGIVIAKEALEGAYVSTGTPIYTIADLSQVWVKLDAYESDLPWLRYGQEVSFTAEAYPGETFTGRIVFIDPILDARTRTVTVRVNVANPDGRLKPGLFLRAVVRARASADGRVYDENLAGKWISPMHPEVIKDGPGACDVCGMPLVPVESLGYTAGGPEDPRPPLVIPASAPLITGKRSLVYVADPDRPGVYTGREVVLGPRAGDHYLVAEGLDEGERVVVQGAFKIDSALQIQGKPSMMSPVDETAGHDHAMHAEETAPEPMVAPERFKRQLEGAYALYFEIQRALSHDEFDPARKAARDMDAALAAVDMGLLEHEAHMAWMKILEEIESARRALADSEDMKGARVVFEDLSKAFTRLSRVFGRVADSQTFVYHCPMAFDNRGADWLQQKEGTENPYYGSAMFKCGMKTATLPADPASAAERDHE